MNKWNKRYLRVHNVVGVYVVKDKSMNYLVTNINITFDLWFFQLINISIIFLVFIKNLLIFEQFLFNS